MPVVMKDNCQLGLNSSTLFFDKNASKELSAKLSLQKQHTKLIDLTNESSIFFSNNGGRLRGTYAVSAVAISQICSMLAPGLGQVVGSLCGYKNFQQQSVDPNLAYKLLNDLIYLRFKDSLKGCRLVVDSESNTVEGILGPNVVYWPNIEIFNRSRELISTFDSKLQFMAATLTGRRILIHFLNLSDKSGSVPSFTRGLYVSNSEVGESGIRVGDVLCSGPHNGFSLGNLQEGGWISHITADKFDNRFLKLLQKGLKLHSRVEVDTFFVQSQQKNLDLGADYLHKACKIAFKLWRAGLAHSTAKKVLGRLLLYSTKGQSLQKISLQKTDRFAHINQLTMLDLYNAITWEAQELPADKRENAEQFARTVLCGNFSL